MRVSRWCCIDLFFAFSVEGRMACIGMHAGVVVVVVVRDDVCL